MTATVFGLTLALLSSALLNLGLFEQQRSVSSLPPLDARHPLRTTLELVRRRRWLVGFVIGCGGWALYVAALGLAPLSLVQALSAAGIGVLALAAIRAGELDPSTVNLATIGLGGAGMVLLGLSLAGALGSGDADHRRLAMWMIATFAVAAVLTVTRLRERMVPGAALGIAAGVLYAGGDVLTKAVVAGSLSIAFVALILTAHGLAFVTLQAAFRRGGPLATVGTATLLTNALPIVAGLIVFHEPFPSGPSGAARVAGLVATVAAAGLLAGGGVRAAAPSPRPSRAIRPDPT